MADHVFTLPSGHRAVVDLADAPLITRNSWHALQLPTKTYVQGRIGSRGLVLLHRVIAGAGPGEYVDHRDGDGLNDRRSNLRVSTMAQNMGNVRRFAHNRSGYRGVSWRADSRKWRAAIVVAGRQRPLGLFLDPWEAAQAYNAAAFELWGEFAVLNEPLAGALPSPRAAVHDAGFPDPLSRKAARS